MYNYEIDLNGSTTQDEEYNKVIREAKTFRTINKWEIIKYYSIIDVLTYVIRNPNTKFSIAGFYTYKEAKQFAEFYSVPKKRREK